MLSIVIPVTRFLQNCSLLVCEDTLKAVVIDPGGDIERILEEAHKVGADIEKILITHGHLDHASAAGALAKQLGVKIEGPHQGDQFLFKELPAQCSLYGFPSIQPFMPDRWLQHEEHVRFGKQTLQVVHCPGHTPGHVAYFHAPSKLAAVGDILFAGSIGATTTPYGNHPQLVQSIRERLFPLGDRVRFTPGHGRQSTFGFEREFNPFVGDDLFF